MTSPSSLSPDAPSPASAPPSEPLLKDGEIFEVHRILVEAGVTLETLCVSLDPHIGAALPDGGSPSDTLLLGLHTLARMPLTLGNELPIAEVLGVAANRRQMFSDGKRLGDLQERVLERAGVRDSERPVRQKITPMLPPQPDEPIEAEQVPRPSHAPHSLMPCPQTVVFVTPAPPPPSDPTPATPRSAPNSDLILVTPTPPPPPPVGEPGRWGKAWRAVRSSRWLRGPRPWMAAGVLLGALLPIVYFAAFHHPTRRTFATHGAYTDALAEVEAASHSVVHCGSDGASALPDPDHLHRLFERDEPPQLTVVLVPGWMSEDVRAGGRKRALEHQSFVMEAREREGSICVTTVQARRLNVHSKLLPPGAVAVLVQTDSGEHLGLGAHRPASGEKRYRIEDDTARIHLAATLRSAAEGCTRESTAEALLSLEKDANALLVAPPPP